MVCLLVFVCSSCVSFVIVFVSTFGFVCVRLFFYVRSLARSRACVFVWLLDLCLCMFVCLVGFVCLFVRLSVCLFVWSFVCVFVL